MKHVRIIRNWKWPDLLQQTPGRTGIWQDVQFTEEKTQDCDFCVILNNLGAGEEIPFPPERVFRVVQEPPTEFFKKWHVNPSYSIKTFTCDPECSGVKYVRSHPLVPWHINRDYDFLTRTAISPKTALLSWITSTKDILPGHRRRMDFLRAISGNIAALDLLGTQVHHIVNPEARRKNAIEQQQLGFCMVEDKWAGLAPYKYSLAIENFSGPDYWTEKLADCFLAWTMPIYFGCTNLEEYFPAGSFINIDIGNPGQAIEIILRILRDDPWEKRLAAISEARRAVLEKHQLFPTLSHYFFHADNLKNVSKRLAEGAVAGHSVTTGNVVPMISVIVCTFNRERLLSDCLQALADQTISNDSYEVLMIDNNSSDRTPDLCAGFTKKYANFKYYREPNQGLSLARNMGLSKARAEYIAFMDDDSIADSHWLEEALRIIAEKRPDIFGGPVYPILNGEEPVWFKQEYGIRGDMGETGWLEKGFIIGTNIFFRKELLLEYGGFDSRFGMKGDHLGYHEETQLVFRALKEKKTVFYSRELLVSDILPDYKKSLAYYLLAKYQAGADGLDIWESACLGKNLHDLPVLLKKAMEEFNLALLRRDKEKYPYPENYLLEFKNLNIFFELGMLTEFLLREKDKVAPDLAVCNQLDYNGLNKNSGHVINFSDNLSFTRSGQMLKQFGIIVFGYRRKQHLQSVLESLKRQNILPLTHVWIDGYSYTPELKEEVDGCQGLEVDYPQAYWQFHVGHLGIDKLMIDGLSFMARQYEKIIILEDDCFPTNNAIRLFLDHLAEIENDPSVYSVYGHHFEVPNEGKVFSRFQGWGWATTQKKLMPVLLQLKSLFMLPEPEYLKWTATALTTEVIARLDVTPGRDVIKVLNRQFSWDSTTALLSAILGMSHCKTSERVVYNCGLGANSGHFHSDRDFLRKPPFNMIGVDEVWKYFNR